MKSKIVEISKNRLKNGHAVVLVPAESLETGVVNIKDIEVEVLTPPVVSKWASVDEKLPKIKEGYSAVKVLVSAYDPGCELSHTQDAMWDGENFMELYCGNDPEWGPIQDKATHWMYYPKPMEVI